MNLLSNKTKMLLSFPDKVIITTALTKSDGSYTEKKKLAIGCLISLNCPAAGPLTPFLVLLHSLMRSFREQGVSPVFINPPCTFKNG